MWICTMVCLSKSSIRNPPRLRGTRMRSKQFRAIFFLSAAFSFFGIQTARAESKVLAEAKSAFATGDYPKAIEILNREAAISPRDAAVQYLLAPSYLQSKKFDRPISPPEPA